MRDAVFNIVSHGSTRDTSPYSLWTLIEALETQGWLNEYINALLSLLEANQEATGAVFALNGKFNCADLYATSALFRQMWLKLLWAMTVEALIEQKQGSKIGAGTLPTKGEVTAWLAAGRRRRAAGRTDKINKRVHRRIRSGGEVLCFETLDQEQIGLCVDEFGLANG